MTNYLMQQNSPNKLGIATGVALAGIAVICAIPKTRKFCLNWINKTMQKVKQRKELNGSNTWRDHLNKAEDLKGPVTKRKDTSKIKVASAGTNAWKQQPQPPQPLVP